MLRAEHADLSRGVEVMRIIIVSIMAASFMTLACSGADAPEPGVETASVQEAMLGCDGPDCLCCDWVYDRCLEHSQDCDGEICYQEKLECERNCW
jgi:hypothetical protein